MHERDESRARNRLITNRRARRLRRFWRMLPSPPRCKLCTSPFGAPFGPPLRLIGKGRWPGNRRYCAACFRELYRRECFQTGVDYLPLDTSMQFDKALLEYLVSRQARG